MLPRKAYGGLRFLLDPSFPFYRRTYVLIARETTKTTTNKKPRRSLGTAQSVDSSRFLSKPPHLHDTQAS